MKVEELRIKISHSPYGAVMIQLKEGTYFGEDVQTLQNDWISLSITSYDEDTVLQEHHHENSYLSLLLAGEYSEETTYNSKTVRPGELIFRPGYYSHQNRFSRIKGSCFNIELKPGWNEILDWKLPLPERCIHFQKPDFPALFTLLYNFKTCNKEDYCIEFISEWLKEVNHDKDITNKPLVNKLIKILENEFSCFHSLASLSERVKAHPVYMSRVFKSWTGMTIGEYQLNAKLKHAVKVLFTTNDPISEVSFAHGFYDDAHFIRSFKTMFGVSPNQFRLQIKS